MRRYLALTLLLAVGCAPDPASAPSTGRTVVTATSSDLNASLAGSGEPSLDVIRAPQEQVLRALSQVYTGLGLAAAVDPRGTSVGTGTITLRGRIENRPNSVYFDCGITSVGQSGADVHRVTVVVRSSVSPDPSGGTAVRTLVEGSARATGGGSTTPVRCASTGELEKRIAQLVQTQLTQ
jgi:hypothetical protein